MRDCTGGVRGVKVQTRGHNGHKCRLIECTHVTHVMSVTVFNELARAEVAPRINHSGHPSSPPQDSDHAGPTPPNLGEQAVHGDRPLLAHAMEPSDGLVLDSRLHHTHAATYTYTARLTGKHRRDGGACGPASDCVKLSCTHACARQGLH